MRILLHPGFHKTGTSSLQRGALAHAETLCGELRLLLAPDLREATRAAKSYSSSPTPRRLLRFAQAFSDAIAVVPKDEHRSLLISAEDLSGHFPGLHGVSDYSAAPALIETAIRALHARFNTAAETTVWLCTRSANDWLKSLYWQNLRAQRLTEDFESFAARLAPAATFAPILNATRLALGSRARLDDSAIEEFGAAPLGPLGHALELLGLPMADLPPLPRHNRQPEGGPEALLALNRSDLPDNQLKTAKRDLLKMLRNATARPPD